MKKFPSSKLNDVEEDDDDDDDDCVFNVREWSNGTIDW